MPSEEKISNMLIRLCLNPNSLVRCVSVLCAMLMSSSSWSFSLFGPSDYETCEAEAAKDAKTQQALEILVRKCDADFPARKDRQGRYAYFEGNTKQWIAVSGAKMTKQDWAKVNQVIADFEKTQAEEAKARAEEAERKYAEAIERQKQQAAWDAYIREEERKKQLQQAERDAKALRGIKVLRVSLSCDGSFICITRHITMTIQNSSEYDVRRIGLGILVTTDNKPDCSGSHAENYFKAVDLRSNKTTTISFPLDHGGPSSMTASSCVWATSARTN